MHLPNVQDNSLLQFQLLLLSGAGFTVIYPSKHLILFGIAIEIRLNILLHFKVAGNIPPI